MNRELITDMQVAEVQLDDNLHNTEDKENTLRENLLKLACFEHKESFEYIIYIDNRDIESSDLPDSCKQELKQAKQKGFKYICFYA